MTISQLSSADPANANDEINTGAVQVVTVTATDAFVIPGYSVMRIEWSF